MYRDPRGGHNQKFFNKNFFKTWTPSMAYVLGFILADGAIIDARKSSRTCYVSIKINDLDLLEEIKEYMCSKHTIRYQPPRFTTLKNKTYFCKASYLLRFGSKVMFQDLINLGVTPRKALRLKLPKIEEKYFPFLLRGYLDGDGCIYIDKRKNKYSPIIQVIFTSGCKEFLKDLSIKLTSFTKTNIHNVLFSGNGAYQLRYKKRESLKIINYIYKDLTNSPFLKRKYLIAKPYLDK